jgi:16S rRNA (adenine1518-N6/adenine1519-N6)-dimethyltransferase
MIHKVKKSLGLKTHFEFARAKKALGQNFLKSEPALRKIIEAGEIKPDDIILEIGPGKGALTKKLLERAGVVIAVEKDDKLFEFLKNKFGKKIKTKKLILLNEDILGFDINNFRSNYKIIANIPYNITGAILKKFLTAELQPERMVLMLQNEVAKRITTPGPSSTRRGGKESLLSISVKAYGEPKMIMKVPARYFSPAPKVDSAVISIKNISRKNFNSPLEEYPSGGGGCIFPSPSQGEGLGVRSVHPDPMPHRVTPQEGNKFEQRFWEIVKAGFAHKRKKLSGNLKHTLGGGNASALMAELGNKRAEDLTLADWILLAKMET